MTSTVSLLCGIFTQALGLDCEGTDDFYDMGGDSLNAATLIEEVNHRLGTALEPGVLLDYGTPELLAAHVAQQHPSHQRDG